MYFDYGAAMYPEGLVDAQVVYFNQKDIFKEVFTGFRDEADLTMFEEINRAIQQLEEEKNQPPHNPWEEK